jgi:hypothetical protein
MKHENVAANPEVERLRRKITAALGHPRTPEVAAAIERHQTAIDRHLGLVPRTPRFGPESKPLFW